MQAFIERKFRRAIFGHLAAFLALAGTEDLTLDHGAVLVLQRLELGKGVDDRELVGITGVNSGHERVNGVVEKFLVEPARDELADAFLDPVAARRNEGFAQHGELRLPGEEIRREKAERLGGHFNWPLVTHDVARLGF